MKGAAALTASWATAEEAMGRGGAEGPQGPTPTRGSPVTTTALSLVWSHRWITARSHVDSASRGRSVTRLEGDAVTFACFSRVLGRTAGRAAP